MPIFPNQTEPEIDGREREDTAAAQSGSQSDAQSGSQGGGRGEAPLSFVPHPGNGAQAVKIQTGRYGELDHHELIRLLDTIEDERARSRFRESVYLSIFVWIVVAWVVLYGPRYLWHAPQLINPSDVLKQHEVVHLDSPVLTPHMKSPAPRPTVENKLDNKTLEKLRAMAKSAPTAPPAAPPTATQPAPTATAPVVPPQVTPQPQVRTPPPVVAEAPTPQAPTRPNFGRPSSAGDAIQQAIQGSAQGRGGTGTASMGSGRGAQTQTGTGVDILSDTQGVNFDPYLRRILAQIYQQWILLIPEEARPPLSKQGTTLVRFTINADGSLGHMALDGSTHDDALNRAAWGSINGQQFPPLPPQFHGPNLELRIRFLVNQKTE